MKKLIILWLLVPVLALADRDPSGTYTLHVSNPVSSGSPITSSWANNTLTDIAAALTDSLSRSGKGGMSNALKLTDGTAGSPALTFTNDQDTGIYSGGVGANDLHLVIGGLERFRCNTTGCGFANSGYNFYLGPATLTGNITWTLPATLPGSTLPLTITSGGTVAHQVLTTAMTDATSTITNNTLVKRDANGRAEISTPTTDNEIANKVYVDARTTMASTTADLTDNTGIATYTDITGLSFAVAANKDYWFVADLVVGTSLATAGLGIQITGPAAPTQVTYTYTFQDSSLVTQILNASAFSGSLMPADMPVARQVVRVAGVIRNGSNAGTAQFQFALETTAGGGTVTVYRGSTLQSRLLN